MNCPHCGEGGLVAFKKDGNLLFKLLELLVGKARETQDLNVRSESLVAILNQGVPVTEITVHAIDPMQSKVRREIIEQDD